MSKSILNQVNVADSFCDINGSSQLKQSAILATQ